MSGFRAIGAVSSTLRNLLQDRMESPRPVTIAPPGVTIAEVAGKRVNLFLYRVTENGFLKNQEIPGQGHPGAYGHPPLSLDLHYLITVFDPDENDQMVDTADLASQEILGDVMRVLHDFPVVDCTLKRQRPPPAGPILDPALLNEFEKVKLYLEPIGSEELTNVWTALSTAYRLSVGYQVSVVQIESRTPREAALPVQVRQVFVRTLRTPQIAAVYREPPINGVRSASVAVGETLRIEGSNLAGDATRVTLGSLSLPIASPGDEQIDVVVPGLLPAGVHPVQVVRDLVLGTPADPHHGFSSNLMPFVLIPSFSGPLPAPAAAGATVRFTLNPLARVGQEVVLLLGDRTAPAAPPPSGLAVQRLAPDAILQRTNFTAAGTVGDVAGDPDAPGTGWLTALNNNVDVELRVSFPTPASNPVAAPILQEFRALVRKTAGSGSGAPTARIELHESNVLRATSPVFNVGEGPTLISMTWDAALLGTANGSQVEAKIVGVRSGGAPAQQAAVDMGAVGWNVNALLADVAFVLPPPPGEYLLRVRVDGAESRLNFNPATGQFTGPKYTVT